MSKQETEKTGKKINIEVELPLTDKAKVERGLKAAGLIEERDELIAEKKKMNFGYNQQIKGLDAQVKSLLDEFTTGKELKVVQATEVKNFTNNVVEYWHKDTIVQSRPMNFADRQTELPVDKKFAAVHEIKKGRSKKNSKQEETGTEGEEIEKVIRAEKGRNTKHSAVDGPKA